MEEKLQHGLSGPESEENLLPPRGGENAGQDDLR